MYGDELVVERRVGKRALLLREFKNFKILVLLFIDYLQKLSVCEGNREAMQMSRGAVFLSLFCRSIWRVGVQFLLAIRRRWRLMNPYVLWENEGVLSCAAHRCDPSGGKERLPIASWRKKMFWKSLSHNLAVI